MFASLISMLETLTVFTLNARSLKIVTLNSKELLPLKRLFHLDKPNIFGISKTWLNSSISDVDLTMYGYNFYRKKQDHWSWWWCYIVCELEAILYQKV